MYEQIEKPIENKSRAVAGTVAPKKSAVKQGAGFLDNRPKGFVRRSLQGMFQRNPGFQPIQKTGSSDSLKSGMEHLSDMDLNEVRVHSHSANENGSRALLDSSNKTCNPGSTVLRSSVPAAQFKEVTPTYTGAGHSTQVEVTLGNGDTMPAGSDPTADVTGYDKLQTLGLTGGADNNHRWVKFHVLNQRAGGAGDNASNLTPATQTANHIKAWNTLEKNEKTFLTPAVETEGGIVVDEVHYKASVGYHGAGNVYWKKTDGSGTTETTNSSHYPNDIDAFLEVDWAEMGWNKKKYDAHLQVADGLFKPEDLSDVPGWQAYSDNTHTTPIAGAV